MCIRDRALAGAFLRRHAKGVRIIDDQVSGLDRDPETGDIRALLLDSWQRVEADFFVDCSGFRRRLITELGAAWSAMATCCPSIAQCRSGWTSRRMPKLRR